ncbi:MAG: VaFE repeat-containing surface-anchored protein [Mogibacterium sp.]|nr:VaFE repeat-containing surface-anchored protein [Mogibacterium sp.]
MINLGESKVSNRTGGGGLGEIRRLISLALSILLILGAAAHPMQEVNAAASTVTLKYGSDIQYGSGIAGHTTVKWVTHIDGEAVDLDSVAGVTRSYAYCVQPTADSPDEGTYNVTVVDEDGSGKVSKMRKLIYYLPGSYGYKNVTKKRWFKNSDSVTDDYIIGHLALSWIYDGYSDSYNVWGGAPNSMVKKTKEIVADLDNLPEPPDSFEIFWIKEKGKQDVFGAFYDTEYGSARVVKSSSNPLITGGNSCYSLEGAKYTLYEDADCKKVAKTKNGKNAVLTVGANGESNTIEIETGQYYIKETSAPRGYALDTAIHNIEVLTDKTSTFTAHDIPKSNQINLLLQKVDKETGKAVPQGAASLEGAEYQVKYYDITPSGGMTEADMAAAVSGRTPATINGREAVWLFKTDGQGRVDMSQPDTYLIKDRSADMYRNSAGNPVFPIGIVSIQETSAPEGYLIDSGIRYASITESGDVENLTTYNPLTDARALKEQVKRGDISLKKAAEGGRRMEGIEFSFTSLTTGEKHILITDKNGYLSSAASWNPHSNATNAGKTDKDGIWFNGYNDEGIGAAVDDSLGALPYDIYHMEELRSEANKGYELISDTISIERDRVVLDLGTYDDAKEPAPELSTQARDAASGTNLIKASKEICIVDTVRYKNVKPGKTYTIDGILMDKSTAQPMTDDAGAEIRGSGEFTPSSAEGIVEVKFTFCGEKLGGKTGVVFEYLKFEGETVAEHTDINSKEQTVIISKPEEPRISTLARDDESGTHEAMADEEVKIIDEIMYENLEKGEKYVIEGILMDKKSGKEVTDDEGKKVRGVRAFTAAAKNGTVEVEFNLSAKNLAGKSTVVYEYLKKDGEIITSHTDIKSAEQSIKFKKPPADNTPDTGDDSRLIIIFCLISLALCMLGLMLTLKLRNDRLR